MIYSISFDNEVQSSLRSELAICRRILDAIHFAFPNSVAGNGTFLKGFEHRMRERNSFPQSSNRKAPGSVMFRQHGAKMCGPAPAHFKRVAEDWHCVPLSQPAQSVCAIALRFYGKIHQMLCKSEATDRLSSVFAKPSLHRGALSLALSLLSSISEKTMNKTEYRKYLSSRHWKMLRSDKLSSPARRRCGICGCAGRIEVHHLQYRNIFDVTTSDLRRLCNRCHSLAHELMNSGRLKVTSETNHGKWAQTKAAVKRSLGLTGVNCFAVS
jgi:hypothetical protein